MGLWIIAVLFAACLTATAAAEEYLGNYSANPYSPKSTSDPCGAGSPCRQDSPGNPYGEGLEIQGQ